MKCLACGEREADKGAEICSTCEAEITAENKKIMDLEKDGHSHHCACRMVWGDGLCECKVKERR